MSLLAFVAIRLFGFWIGWIGGKAEGRDQERNRTKD